MLQVLFEVIDAFLVLGTASIVGPRQPVGIGRFLALVAELWVFNLM